MYSYLEDQETICCYGTHLHKTASQPAELNPHYISLKVHLTCFHLLLHLPNCSLFLCAIKFCTHLSLHHSHPSLYILLVFINKTILREDCEISSTLPRFPWFSSCWKVYILKGIYYTCLMGNQTTFYSNILEGLRSNLSKDTSYSQSCSFLFFLSHSRQIPG
jgi:hypothetical protein